MPTLESIAVLLLVLPAAVLVAGLWNLRGRAERASAPPTVKSARTSPPRRKQNGYSLPKPPGLDQFTGATARVIPSPRLEDRLCHPLRSHSSRIG